MAPGKKNAARLGAWLVFIDECAFLMAPLVRRGWAPRGETPVIRQRTRSHRKVSAIGALCVAPERDQARLYFRLHPNANVDARRTVAFLAALDRQLSAPFVVIWDNPRVHHAIVVRDFLVTHPHARLVFLPPYAPELNPIEYVWGCLKANRMANLAIPELEELADMARSQARSLQRRSGLLKSFVRHSPLSLHLG